MIIHILNINGDYPNVRIRKCTKVYESVRYSVRKCTKVYDKVYGSVRGGGGDDYNHAIF